MSSCACSGPPRLRTPLQAARAWHGTAGPDVTIGDCVRARGREVAPRIALRFGAFPGPMIAALAVPGAWYAPPI